MSVPESSPSATALDTGEETFEAIRQASLREFEVHLAGGIVHRIHAHFHDGGASNGRLSFVCIDTTGRQIITCVYNTHAWENLKEVTPLERCNEFAQLKLSHAREVFVRQFDAPMPVPEPEQQIPETPSQRLPGRRKSTVH